MNKPMIYVTSSWLCARQQRVVDRLRQQGYDVYDYECPYISGNAFHWYKIDGQWQSWSVHQCLAYLSHPLAREGFATNMAALRACDAVVAIQPFGRSASMELGWACAANKLAILLLSSGEPELMVKMCDHICTDLDEVFSVLQRRFNG